MAAYELRPRRSLSRIANDRDLRSNIDRLWESIARPRPLFSVMQRSHWVPATDVYQTASAVVVTAELPGLTERDFDVSVVGDTLVLKGTKTRPERLSGEYSRAERAYGSFERQVPLPQDADVRGIEATFRNGLLEVRVPIETHPKRRLRLHSCSVCHGDLFPDDDDDELVCLQCGRRTPRCRRDDEVTG